MYELVERGRISHYKIGTAIRISEEQLSEFLEKTRREPSGPVTRNAAGPRPRLKHLRL